MNKSICIVACVKHEELYIKEWLDYHIKCGIDHFFLCDNNEPDYKYPLKDIVKEYISNGIVDIIDYTAYEYVQPYCYSDMYEDERVNKYGWMLAIDIDEFICLPKYDDDIRKFINDIPSHVDSISINWRYYGDNGLVEYDDRPVVERFTTPSNTSRIYDGQSFIIKTMIRTKSNLNTSTIPIINSQHTLSQNIIRYDCLFKRMLGRTRIKFKGNDMSVHNEYAQKLYEVFYLKHYHTKTIEEYIKYKIQRSVSVFVPKKDKNKSYYTVNGFFTFNERTDEKLKKSKEILGE